MTKIALRRLVSRIEVASVISGLDGLIEATIVIQDRDGKVLVGSSSKDSTRKFPVTLGGEVIGWVCGEEKSSVVASLLSCMAQMEYEKRVLGREALAKYKEITLLYDISEKLCESLDPREVALLIIEEIKKMIRADSISVVLTNEDAEILEVVNPSTEPSPMALFWTREGIVNHVILTGQAEIVNDIRSDSRCYESATRECSLMCSPLKIKDRVIGAIYLSSNEPVLYTSEDLKLLSSVAFLAAANIETARLYDSLKETFITTVQTLSETIEKRNPYTGGHTKRVMNYSISIGNIMGLSGKEIGRLETAAMLHDIGKIGVSDNILLKEGRLTDEEFEEIKMHTVYAEEILLHIKHLRDIIPAVKCHHERYDGTGYPEKLQACEINIAARIIAVADAFDAMMTDRPYRKAYSLDRALDEIRKNAGTQFDPVVVEAFFAVFNR